MLKKDVNMYILIYKLISISLSIPISVYICIISSLKGLEEIGSTLILERGIRKPREKVEKEIVFHLAIFEFLNIFSKNK